MVVFEKVYTILNSSKTWHGAYAKLFDYATQLKFQCADTGTSMYDLKANLLGIKKDDDPYHSALNDATKFRSMMSIDATAYQTQLLQSRIDAVESIMSKMWDRISVTVAGYCEAHDYDRLMLIEFAVTQEDFPNTIESLQKVLASDILELGKPEVSQILSMMESSYEVQRLPKPVGNLNPPTE